MKRESLWQFRCSLEREQRVAGRTAGNRSGGTLAKDDT